MFVASLTVSEACELLRIAEDELDLEPRSVKVEYVTGGHRQVSAEERLSGLTLLLGIKIIDDDNADFTFKAYCPYVGPVHLVDEFAVDAVVLLEDVHVKVVDINFAGELLRSASLVSLGTTVEILQVDVITESADEIEAQGLHSSDEALFGEVGVCHNEIADG